MKKHWLAVIKDKELYVAKVAVGKNNEMKVTFLAEYDQSISDDVHSERSLTQQFSHIKTWLKENNIPYKKLKFAVSSLGLITRVIALPQMPNDDLEKIITDHIDQYFTLNVNNYIIDYRILTKYKDHDKPMQNVLIAAFPREKMKYVWSLCKYLGFEPTVVDLHADCLSRLYSSLSGVNSGSQPIVQESHSLANDMAIVSFYKDKVEFVFLEKGIFFLYSDMAFNWNAIVQHFSKVAMLEKKVIPNNKSKEEKKEETPENEITLNLSSYVHEKDKSAHSQDKKELDKTLFSQNGELHEPFNYYLERDRLLNELITIEKIDKIGINQTNTLDLKQMDSNESYESQLMLAPNAFYSEDEELKNTPQDEMLDFVDDTFFKDLAKVQLDFSIKELRKERQDQQGQLAAFDSETLSLEKLNIQVLNEVLAEIEGNQIEQDLLTNNLSMLKDLEEQVKGLPAFSTILDENNSIKEDHEKYQEDNEKYQQVALNINKKKRDNEEFVLEDLFVPLENLDQELEITMTNKEFESTFGTSTEKLSDLFIEDLNEINQDDFESHGFSIKDTEVYHEDELKTPESERIQEIQDIPYMQDINEIEDIKNLQALKGLADLSTIQYSPEKIESSEEDIQDYTQDDVTQLTQLAELQEFSLGEDDSIAISPIGERSIFDPLDLNIPNVGIEEIEAELLDKDPKEELENSLSPILMTLSELLSFFAARHFGQSVSTIYLTGENCQLASLPEIFQENLGVQTLIGFPNGWKPRFEKKSFKFERRWSNYGCLYGLALRED